MKRRTPTGGTGLPHGRRRAASSATSSGLPTGSSAPGEPDGDALTVTTHTGHDGEVTVSVVGELDTSTAPLLRSVLETELTRGPSGLVLDLRGVRFLGSAGLALLVETRMSAQARDVPLRLIATTRPVIRPLEITGLIDLFSLSDDAR